ncbi:ribosomal RNA adenine dimethylase-domain-containing protein [Halteromyces radiatus]|uniref:ribosomal RNA adenine dimethylase-domain-containing protein n=1 Tax=Halteromyces radiatus TaxID=101107 RepID=UPI00221EEE23|nr:ribosomal RNA adenine dimethylase-domain-containing protein [Halteromyces radiatus]KAI8089560.1 ribosomal RNA adenine dimethylase-domain-containing protein [Halteromyces radiatus]
MTVNMSSIRSLIPKIPTQATWNKKFRSKGSLKAPRCTLNDLKVAENGFEMLRQQSKWTNSDILNMTVVEINPGLGAWTSALFHGGFKKIYALEPNLRYFDHIQDLSDKSNGVLVPLKKDGYDWQTYVELRDDAYLGKLMTTDWSTVNPNILFTGTLPKSSLGEQLLAQFATCIVNKMALHSMGRIQMALWMPDQLLHKFISPPGSTGRCKMSVVTEACADIDVICSTEPTSIYPYNVYHLVNIVPIPEKKTKAEWDVFEYVLKHIFVMQRQPLSKMVR